MEPRWPRCLACRVASCAALPRVPRCLVCCVASRATPPRWPRRLAGRVASLATLPRCLACRVASCAALPRWPRCLACRAAYLIESRVGSVADAVLPARNAGPRRHASRSLPAVRSMPSYRLGQGITFLLVRSGPRRFAVSQVSPPTGDALSAIHAAPPGGSRRWPRRTIRYAVRQNGTKPSTTKR
jgi:hypothetical protein